MVGVVSDELVSKYKNLPVLTDVERYESVRNCKWSAFFPIRTHDVCLRQAGDRVDEVIEDAPWEVTQEFIDKHQIDYVAHGQSASVGDASQA